MNTRPGDCVLFGGLKRLFHVSSSANRESILAHGLDWQRMSARGIAGSDRPEQAGCFLCRDDWEVDWFVKMNNTGGPVDVWAVDGVDPRELVDSPQGHCYVGSPISAEHLTLIRRDIPPMRSSNLAPEGHTESMGIILRRRYGSDNVR